MALTHWDFWCLLHRTAPGEMESGFHERTYLCCGVFRVTAFYRPPAICHGILFSFRRWFRIPRFKPSMPNSTKCQCCKSGCCKLHMLPAMLIPSPRVVQFTNPQPHPLDICTSSICNLQPPPPHTHNLARLSNVLLLFCSLTALPNSLASSPLNVAGATPPFPSPFPSPAIASPNNFPPNSSANPTTRVLTVAPSRRFLPSRRLDAIFSVNSHSLLPAAGASRPVAASRAGRQSGARRRRGGMRGSRERTTWMMPSSSKRWYEFLRVSLLTASK